MADRTSYTNLPDGGEDGVLGLGEEGLLFLPVQDETPGQARLQDFFQGF